jgi:formylmethanofuran dehydrogenase subunit E
MTSSELESMMKQAVKFHGHSCPGLAIGVVVSKIALENAKRAADEELVAVVENDACGIDAIQVLTGCTFGKGNLIHNDYGKSVYTFYNRNTDKAIRISLKNDIFDSGDGQRRRELSKKINDGTATNTEIKEHEKLRDEFRSYILDSADRLFNIQEIDIVSPSKARRFDNIKCELCGEPVMATRIQNIAGQRVCMPCAKKLDVTNK